MVKYVNRAGDRVWWEDWEAYFDFYLVVDIFGGHVGGVREGEPVEIVWDTLGSASLEFGLVTQVFGHVKVEEVWGNVAA
jgi:hypothetical protein